MSIHERDRIALHDAAKETWGPEVAVTLMEMLPATGWAELTTKADLAAVKSEIAGMKVEFATKADLEVFASQLQSRLDGGLRTQLMWTVTTMIGGFSGIAAVMGIVLALTR